MRQPTSFSPHRIAGAFFDSLPSFSVFMAAFHRPPFRGGRSRGGRRFSNRPPLVSGDSHFQSVHDSNSAFQRSSESRTINNCNYNNNHNSNFQNMNSPSISGNNNFSGNFRGRSPPFNQRPNQSSGVRIQRPKPADYRTWEIAKLPPPPDCERFVVLSYNILADYLANSHRRLYFHIPRRFMSWDWRKGNILFELRLWSPDIMCFQEVDRFRDLEEDLSVRGYSGIWKMRTGDPIDGCAIFWRTSKFRLMYEECIEFSKHGMRDNVAQICVLESLVPNHKGNQLASSPRSGDSNRVVICNIHVLYNPRRGEIKFGQVRILLERAQAVSKTWDDAPVVLCGDFNCTPMSPLYNFISGQKVDISEVDRDKVSGQASAEIRPPPRQYGPQVIAITETSDSYNSSMPRSDVGEDAEESVSDANSGGDAFPPNLGDLIPEDETVVVDKPYNPSLWTPMETATATGNANSTILEHPLKLRSTYAEVVESTGTRDSNGEPLVTSYNSCFMGTVDYIWRSEGLFTAKVLAPISKEAMQPSGGFPTKKWGSDHIALASELAFTKK